MFIGQYFLNDIDRFPDKLYFINSKKIAEYNEK